jgi:hypothetical protein
MIFFLLVKDRIPSSVTKLHYVSNVIHVPMCFMCCEGFFILFVCNLIMWMLWVYSSKLPMNSGVALSKMFYTT